MSIGRLLASTVSKEPMKRASVGNLKTGHSLLVLLALSLTAVSCRTVQVRSMADPKADFSTFRTFNIAKPATSTNALRLSERNRAQIESAVRAELARRSLTVAEEPDLLFSIDWATSVKSYDKTNPDVESGSMGANLSKHYGLLYDESLGSQPLVQYREGSLSFRALDTKQNRLAWEGLAVGVLYENRPDEQVQKRIQEAVGAVFANFPIPSQRR